jgi:SulP family sulfate permease
MGFIVDFLSKPVINGFTSASAIIIGLSQIKHLIGIPISQSNKLHLFVASLINSEHAIHLPTLTIGIVSMLIIVLIKKWNAKIPSALITVLIGSLWVYFSQQNQQGVAVVGDIPEGLPTFSLPIVDWLTVKQLFPIAFTIAIVAYMEAISVAKAIQGKHKSHELNPNQELLALGASNMIGSLFQSYPTTGGFSRTAVNKQAGAKTGFASLISALIVGITLSFLTRWFFYLPKAVLGAIIIVAVFNLIDLKYARRLYRSRKDEFALLILTFILTIFVGISQGILFGIILSLLLLVYRTSKPHYAFLGRIGTTNYFKNIARFPDEVVLRDDLIILRFDAQLFFGNIQFFKQLVLNAVEKKQGKVKGFIINARAINYIDSTATEQLVQLIKKLQKNNIRVMIVGAIGPARDLIIKSKLIHVLKKENLFITSGDATDSFDGICKKTPLQKKLSGQTNL